MHGIVLRSSVTGGGKKELEKWSGWSVRTSIYWKGFRSGRAGNQSGRALREGITA